MTRLARHLIFGSAVLALGCGERGLAADPAAWPPAPAVPWTGPYVGAHLGYGTGSFGPGTNPVHGEALFLDPSVTGFVGGFQAGYNWQRPDRVVLGVEADVSFLSPPQPDEPVRPYGTTFDYIGTLRPRLGYAMGGFLPFVTGGFAWGRSRIDLHDAEGAVTGTHEALHAGWTAGAGLEYAFAGPWTARVEYDYIDLGSRTVALPPPAPAALAVDPAVHRVTLGLNYRPGAPKDASSPGGFADPNDWSIHGQTTLIPQGYPNIHSPYQGANSLPGHGQVRETWTATAFVGRKLWEGGEVYINPELAQGFGVGGTLGLGGFANGEAQKAGADYPRIRLQRYFFRQTFGFGGGEETVEDGPNQIAGKRDIDRLTLTIGRFAVTDYFDNNAYAHDPCADFMNWALWSSAAYDFPADLPGYTRGAVVELNRKDWALRAGLFQVPEAPNSDRLTFKSGGAAVEWEGRYALDGHAGVLRLGVFGNRGETGSYRQALDAVVADPALDINDAIAGLRSVRSKTGFYANLEQALTRDLGLFARASWNDGRTEILSFTDIDRSISGGLSLKGASWNRPDDTVGIGAAINGLSRDHRDFLAAGGLGLLIGDGALNYRDETVVETYYAIGLARWATLSFDYQFIANPAYNADRGPVSLFGARLHAEF